MNYWFPSANGNNLDRFEELLSPENLDRLQREGGVCIVYTHLGAGSFNGASAVNPRFEARIKDLDVAQWLVRSGLGILDHLRTQEGWTADMGYKERLRLEATFFGGRVLRQGSTRRKS